MGLKPLLYARMVLDGTSGGFSGRETGTFFENVDFSKYGAMGGFELFHYLLSPIFPERSLISMSRKLTMRRER